MTMKNPPDRGGVVLHGCIEPLGLSTAEGWLIQQAQYDPAHVRTGRIRKLKRLELERA
jgi:hypothetical protein